MKHIPPGAALPLFERMGEPSKSDAAPSGNGASAKSRKRSQDNTLVALPLIPPSHRNAPRGTSDVAASMIRGHAARQRADVLSVIAAAGPHGATDSDVESATGIRAQSVSPRRGELRALGLVCDSGVRRLTPRGRPATVWILREHAKPATIDCGASEHPAGQIGGAT
jgi:hypothetical protein